MAIMVGTVSVLLAVVLYAQYRFNRSYAGLGWWAAGQASVAAGFIVSAMRGDSVMGRLAVPAYQILIVLGVALIYVGVLRFLGHRERRAWVAGGVAAFVVWSLVFTFVVDDATLRSVGRYTAIAVFLALAAFALRHFRLSTVRGSATFVSLVFACGSAGYVLLAIAEPFRSDTGNVYFAPSPVNAGAFLIALVTTVLWTFGLVVMINQRLAGEIAVDARNMHSIFATSPDCAIISRLSDGIIDDVNEGFTHLTGYARDEVLGTSAISLGLWADPSAREVMVASLSRGSTVADFPMVLRRKDGTTVECLLAASRLTLEDEPYLIAVVRDVTRQRRMEAELQHEATTDSLTDLPNRRHFLSVCDRELRRAVRSGGPMAIAVVDIDHFKEINDTFGHAVGDTAVVDFARAVVSRIRDIDTFGRLGGDEFGLLLPDADLGQARSAVERLRTELREQPLTAGTPPMAITFSAGVAVVAGDADTVDTLLARADGALYAAKAQGRDRVIAAAG